jgi:ubiquitin-protein ligase E3 A
MQLRFYRGLVITPAGGDPDRLPTSHTCFNHLLLPPYSSLDAMRQALKTAFDNATGFALI